MGCYCSEIIRGDKEVRQLTNISMTDLSEIQFEDLPNLREITFDEVIERENKEQIKEFRDRLDNTEQGK